jgi:hypothetical protein
MDTKDSGHHEKMLADFGDLYPAMIFVETAGPGWRDSLSQPESSVWTWAGKNRNWGPSFYSGAADWVLTLFRGVMSMGRCTVKCLKGCPRRRSRISCCFEMTSGEE